MQIQHLEVRNFLSIESASFDFPSGVTLLKGQNFDVQHSGAPTSNGAGKTAILYATLQCLYNKCPVGTELESVNNTVTMKAYSITLDFTHNGNTYRVINDRTKLRISVYENGELLAERITEALKVIESILGVSYTSFLGLYFVTPTTLGDLFGADANVITQHFALEQLVEFQANFQVALTELNKQVAITKVQIQDSLNVVHLDFSKTSVDKAVATIEKDIATLKETHDFIVTAPGMAEDIQAVQKEVNNLQSIVNRIKQDARLLGLSVCPTCGQSLPDGHNEEEEKQLAFTEKRLKEKHQELQKLTNAYTRAERAYHLALTERQTALTVEQSKLVTLEKVQKQKVQNTDKLNMQLVQHQYKAKVVRGMLAYLRGGTIVEAHLYTFLQTLGDTINTTLVEVGFPVEIQPFVYKGTIRYTTYINGKERHPSNLSGGEQTVIGLAILYAFLQVLQEAYNMQHPFVVLDETFGRLDPQNMGAGQQLVQKLAELTPVVVVQHHDELAATVFDREVTVVKQDGLSTLI